MSIYTILERLDKLEKEDKDKLQYYIDVEASVDEIIQMKEKLKADTLKFEVDSKDRLDKIESDIKAIKKALGLS